MTTILFPTITVAPNPPVPVPPPCGMVDKAAILAELIIQSGLQQRGELECDQRLVRAAQWRADNMRDREWFGHTAPDGESPNNLVRRFGFRLPDAYSDANQVESLVWGYDAPDVALRELLKSSKHRTHILGENAFFEAQNRIGVGHSMGGILERYWVVLIARRS